MSDNSSTISPVTPASNEELVLLRSLRQAFDETSIISVTDARGVITYANENFIKISGYSRDEIIGKTHSIVNSKHHPTEFWQTIWKTIASGKIWSGEVCNRAKAGHSYWVQSSIAAIRDTSGKIAGYISISHDITEAKRLEAELRAGRRLQELIMETAPVGIFRTDSEGICNYVNRNWIEITGITYENSMGEGWILPIHPDDKYKVFGAWGDFVTGQTHFEMRWRFQRPDGEIRWVQGTAAAVRNDTGRIVSYLGACVDVTALIAAQKDLEYKQSQIIKANKDLTEQARELERASRAKSMFLANMSHEIRTPLNGVLGMGQFLSKSDLPHQSAEVVNDIINSGEMLMGIINDLLDFSKIDAGNMILECREFAPREAISKTVALVQKTASEKSLNLIVNISPEIPEMISGDELRLRQIILNLLSNAVKFTTHGSVTIRASWQTDTMESGQLKFDVIDTGIGMTQDQRARLFTPFTQADETITRRFGGTGLGLTIAKRLAELMDGDIKVVTEIGKGSTFTFSATVKTCESVSPSQSTQRPDEAEINLSGLKIMVAEDNATNQKLIKLIFQRLGIDHTLAQNGLEAVNFANREPWDLIFMDLQMPEMGGIEATKAIRAGNGPSKHSQIIALTANAFEDDKKACVEAGMNGFLSKPLRVADLEATLRDLARDKSTDVPKKAG